MANGLSIGASDPFGLQDLFSAAQTAGSDQSYVTPRTSDTATGDAINGGAPIDNDSGSAWSSFFRDTVKTIVGYEIAKDAQQHTVMTPANASQQAAAQAQAQARSSWLMPAVIVGGVVLAVIAFKKAG
jgi:hypothetical protein